MRWCEELLTVGIGRNRLDFWCSLPYTGLRSTTQCSDVNIFRFNYAIAIELERTADGLGIGTCLTSQFISSMFGRDY
jgi:hypothetical protein